MDTLVFFLVDGLQHRILGRGGGGGIITRRKGYRKKKN